MSMNKRKKQKVNNKSKQQTTYGITFDNIQKFTLLTIIINKKEKSEEVNINLNYISNNIKSLLYHLNSICLRHLTSKKNIFVSQIIKSLIRIEYANKDFFFAQSIRIIRLLYLKKDGFL